MAEGQNRPPTQPFTPVIVAETPYSDWLQPTPDDQRVLPPPYKQQIKTRQICSSLCLPCNGLIFYLVRCDHNRHFLLCNLVCLETSFLDIPGSSFPSASQFRTVPVVLFTTIQLRALPQNSLHGELAYPEFSTIPIKYSERKQLTFTNDYRFIATRSGGSSILVRWRIKIFRISPLCI